MKCHKTRYYTTYKNGTMEGRPSFLCQLDLPLYIHRVHAKIHIFGYPQFLNGSLVSLDRTSPCRKCSLEKTYLKICSILLWFVHILRLFVIQIVIICETFSKSKALFLKTWKILSRKRSFLIFNIINQLNKKWNYLGGIHQLCQRFLGNCYPPTLSTIVKLPVTTLL